MKHLFRTLAVTAALFGAASGGALAQEGEAFVSDRAQAASPGVSLTLGQRLPLAGPNQEMPTSSDGTGTAAVGVGPGSRYDAIAGGRPRNLPFNAFAGLDAAADGNGT